MILINKRFLIDLEKKINYLLNERFSKLQGDEEESCSLLSVCMVGPVLCAVSVCALHVVIRHRAGISEAVKQREKSLLLSLWINEQSFTQQLKMKRMQRCTFPLLWSEPRRNHVTDTYRSALL